MKENEGRITQCEQYNRKCYIEIKGAPAHNQKKFIMSSKTIAIFLQEEIKDDDSEVCHRVPVPSGHGSSNIVVQFTRVVKRKAVLEKARRKKITCFKLQLPSGAAVHVNVHMCPALSCSLEPQQLKEGV